MVNTTGTKNKRGGRRATMGHALHVYSRRHGGAKMPIEITDGERTPKGPVQSAKLSSECGIHIRNKFPLATHWKQYSDKDSPLINVIPDAIKTVAVSLHTSSLHIAE